MLVPLDSVSNRMLNAANVDQNLKDVRERQLHRLKALVQQPLSVSRDLPLQRERIDVNEILQQTLDLVRTEVRHRQVTLKLELAPSLPRVEADASRLDQVFLNLVLNACDAMEAQGGGALTITTEERGRSVAIVFENTGPGMPPEIPDRIFDSFFTTKGGKGNGLGLHGAKRIVEEEHGGRIRVESPSEGGARFTVLLGTQALDEMQV
jgi:signal transduction histidine kinase